MLVMAITSADRAALAGRLERRVWIYALLGNLLGAGIAASNVAIWAPVFLPRPIPHELLDLFAIAVAVMLIAIPVGRLQVRGFFAPVRQWITGRREATFEERNALLGVPRKISIGAVVWWLLVGTVTGIVDVRTPALLHGSVSLVKAEVGVLACAFVGAAFTYLLVERALRPLYAVMLGEDPALRPVRLGVTARLVIVWAVVSAAPLIGTAIQFVGLTNAQRLRASHVVIVTCLLAIPAGVILTFAAARSIADPLREVRRALARVEGGDLDVELAIDDTGEVGSVQSGFNRMVAGLRENRRTHELFGRHVGAEVAELALQGGDELGGTRYDASVLFVDIVGSTRLTHVSRPDQVVALLNDLFEAIVEAAQDAGGWVNKFTGDGALCVFGPPVGDPDHAAKALRAARGIRARIETLQTAYAFEAAIGVSTGDVVAGNVGASSRYEYTLIGDAVNEASRLCDEAKHTPGCVLASESTIARAGAEGRAWVTAGAVKLRGRPAPTGVFEPLLDGFAMEPTRPELRAIAGGRATVDSCTSGP